MIAGVASTESRLKGAMERLEQALANAESAAAKGSARAEIAVAMAASACNQTLRDMLLQNIAANGIKRSDKDKKGKRVHLHDFAQEIYLRARFDSSKGIPRMFIQMPPGYSDDMYKQAVALSYGSVRGVGKKVREIRDLPTGRLVRVSDESAVGASAKRTLKKILFKQKVGKRAKTQLASGSSFYGTSGVNSDVAGKTRAGSFITGSGITVTQARPWLKLTDSQAEQLWMKFNAIYKAELEKEMSNGS